MNTTSRRLENLNRYQLRTRLVDRLAAIASHTYAKVAVLVVVNLVVIAATNWFTWKETRGARPAAEPVNLQWSEFQRPINACFAAPRR